MIRRLMAQLIADDPQPEPSWLDQMDGSGPVGPLCAVLECREAPTTEIHGWRLCGTHSPARV